MAYRDDLEAALARAAALEQELAEVRAVHAPPPVDALVSEAKAALSKPSFVAAAARPMRTESLLDELERQHPSRPPEILSNGQFEEELTRAMELTIDEMRARWRGTPGDGNHSQLLALLRLLVSLWGEYCQGHLPPRPRSWDAVEHTTQGWQAFSELRRVLGSLGDYYINKL